MIICIHAFMYVYLHNVSYTCIYYRMTESQVYFKTCFHRMKFSTKDDFREGILKDIDLLGYISLKNPNFGYISGINISMSPIWLFFFPFAIFQISKGVSISILQPKNSMIVPPIPTVYQYLGLGWLGFTSFL